MRQGSRRDAVRQDLGPRSANDISKRVDRQLRREGLTRALEDEHRKTKTITKLFEQCQHA